MRFINVTERDATHGPVVLQLKKVVVYKYKKKGKHQCLETTGSTRGATIIYKGTLKVTLNPPIH